MKRYKTGLIVGKFSPLHKGHEFAIETAQAACDQLLILTYSNPEFKNFEAVRREQWLRMLYPAATIVALDNQRMKKLTGKALPPNDADDVTHRAFVAFICRALFKLLPQAVFTSEDYGDGFAEYLSRDFGFNVMHEKIDQARTRFPISGTAIRGNIHENRRFLSARIYAGFVQTVCFLGAESTGKSTLCEQAATHFNSVFVKEFGRTLWDEKDGRLEYDDMLAIALQHIRNEDDARLQANRYLFVDTSPLTTLFYSDAMFGKVDPQLQELSLRAYDHYVLCAPDFPLVQDSTRQDEAFRARQHEWHLKTLDARSMPYTYLSGHEGQRLQDLAFTLKAA